ncbi:unnamed protein product [Pleuronectes platessa]|uniref:Uncharacterized protein n=1 Tax=Pleuronectes platessa TaxID=8262 RepID=A0A9N7UJM2_PLEPL|nr:unnamed protein product [Pleuronectes platessa]
MGEKGNVLFLGKNGSVLEIFLSFIKTPDALQPSPRVGRRQRHVKVYYSMSPYLPLFTGADAASDAHYTAETSEGREKQRPQQTQGRSTPTPGCSVHASSLRVSDPGSSCPAPRLSTLPGRCGVTGPPDSDLRGPQHDAHTVQVLSVSATSEEQVGGSKEGGGCTGRAPADSSFDDELYDLIRSHRGPAWRMVEEKIPVQDRAEDGMQGSSQETPVEEFIARVAEGLLLIPSQSPRLLATPVSKLAGHQPVPGSVGLQSASQSTSLLASS